MLWLPRAFHPASPAAGTPHRVHIAFGFHVNLYHSFRGDTNDENGFSQDTADGSFNTFRLPVAAAGDGGYFIADGNGHAIPATVERRDPLLGGRYINLGIRVSRKEAMPAVWCHTWPMMGGATVPAA